MLICYLIILSKQQINLLNNQTIMPVTTRSQARKNQEELRKSISNYQSEKQKIMRDAVYEAVRLIKAASLENQKEKKEFESRLEWFKKYCGKTMDAVAIASRGSDRMRLNYELFFVIDEYFPEILRKLRKNDSYLRYACAIYRKAFEFYCDAEQIAKRNQGYGFVGYDEKYVISFVKYLGKFLTNLEELFYELDLVMVFMKVDCYNYVLKELRRVEYFENIDPDDVIMNWGTNYLSYRESKRIYL